MDEAILENYNYFKITLIVLSFCESFNQNQNNHIVYKSNALQGHSFERIALNKKLWDFIDFHTETCSNMP